MYAEVFDQRRAQFGKFEYDLQSIFGKLTMTCGPYLKSSNIIIHIWCTLK